MIKLSQSRIMKAPVEPNKEDCCNNGCNPCIFDVYEKQLKLYEKYKKSNDESLIENFNGILQYEYTTFVVTETINLCHLHKIIKFKRSVVGPKVWWKPGQHFFILYKSNDKKASRAYTPIKLNNHGQDDFEFSIIVKEYCDGLVSNYLSHLGKGDVTLWRGPYGDYTITPNKFKYIVFIAQGTGIIPFMSIIDKILNNEDDMTKILLYYCGQSTETILFREELYNYNKFWNFSYRIYLSFNCDNVDFKYEEPIHKRKFKFEDVELFQPILTNQYLLCGSNDFMKNYKSSLISHDVPLENIIIF